MRARIKFTTDSVKDTLVGVLKDHTWWPHFDQGSDDALQIITEIRDSLEEGDVGLFDGTDKIILSHTPTESRGTLSREHDVWVIRLLNPNIHSLQLACATLVTQVVEHASRNHKKISFVGPIQIVERKRKETIIQGRTLATPQDRRAYARSHRGVEFSITLVGVVVLVALLFLTYPWSWRNLNNPQQTWIFSVFEKFIGSVAVTTLIAYVGYRSFLVSLREHTIRWSIPGEPETLDIKPHAG
jgi:hypothetical protein